MFINCTLPVGWWCPLAIKKKNKKLGKQFLIQIGTWWESGLQPDFCKFTMVFQKLNRSLGADIFSCLCCSRYFGCCCWRCSYSFCTSCRLRCYIHLYRLYIISLYENQKIAIQEKYTHWHTHNLLSKNSLNSLIFSLNSL